MSGDPYYVSFTVVRRDPLYLGVQSTFPLPGEVYRNKGIHLAFGAMDESRYRQIYGENDFKVQTAFSDLDDHLRWLHATVYDFIRKEIDKKKPTINSIHQLIDFLKAVVKEEHRLPAAFKDIFE